jgi:hypothetical protein
MRGKNNQGALKSIKSQSAMEYLMTYGWAILLIAIVMITLSYLGVFNGPGGTSVCVPNSGFICGPLQFSFTSANIVTTLGQNTGQNWATANIVFVPAGTQVDLDYVFTSQNETLLPGGLNSGQEETVQIPVNALLPGQPVIQAGQSFSGAIWAQYTLSSTYSGNDSNLNNTVYSLEGRNSHGNNPYYYIIDYIQSIMLNSAYYTHLVKSGYFTDLNSSLESNNSENDPVNISSNIDGKISFSGYDTAPLGSFSPGESQYLSNEGDSTRSVVNTLTNQAVAPSSVFSSVNQDTSIYDLFTAQDISILRDLVVLKTASTTSTSTVPTTTSTSTSSSTSTSTRTTTSTSTTSSSSSSTSTITASTTSTSTTTSVTSTSTTSQSSTSTSSTSTTSQSSTSTSITVPFNQANGEYYYIEIGEARLTAS